MNSDDALDLLIGPFTLDGVIADDQGNLAYEFGGDFVFTVSVLSDAMVRLSAPLVGLAGGHFPKLRRRLLAAAILGVETGFGRLAPDPVGSGEVALVDNVALAALDGEDLKLRLVEFMLHVDYWRSLGIRDLLAEFGATAAPASDEGGEFVIRA